MSGSRLRLKKNLPTQVATGGFSLVELLIAMTIGLVLITGMIGVFSGNKQSSELNTAMANMQENARFAMEAISRDARMAGFQGCIDINTSSAIIRASNAPTSDLSKSVATGSVVSSPTSWTPNGPLGFTIPSGDIAPIAGTHTLSLQFGSSVTSRLSAAMTSTGNPLAADIPIADNDGGIRSGDLAIISNCDIADLFRATAAPTAAGSITHSAADNQNNGNLSRAYGTSTTLGNTRVMKFMANIYYVGLTGLQNESGDPITALYQQSLPYTATNPPTELIQGIENMRIRFGIRQSNGSLAYFTADQSGYDSGRVESIQLGLLMNSWERILDVKDERTYVLAGQQINAKSGTSIASATPSGLTHAGDRRYRLAFNTTIKIRNRRDHQI